MHLGALYQSTINLDIGFALDEKSVSSALSGTSGTTLFLYLYDVIGYLMLIFVYIFYMLALSKNKENLLSYHDNFLLSTVIVGIILIIFEFVATVRRIMVNKVNS